ncbi:hypothetical protein [Gordonia sp. MP11Mi]|uniref:Uncharacterized protein n=1 Tax=Gordonia sp. MP11Mi TaxID=3022769 RepID=A0AA97GUF9_9ACTN
MNRNQHSTGVVLNYLILTAFTLIGFVVGTAAIYGTLQAAFTLGLYAGGAA